MEIKTYNVEIKEYLSKTIVIEAESKDSALEKIKQQYKDEEIILYAEDYMDTAFKVKDN